jgi:hypothetical protein
VTYTTGQAAEFVHTMTEKAIENNMKPRDLRAYMKGADAHAERAERIGRPHPLRTLDFDWLRLDWLFREKAARAAARA